MKTIYIFAALLLSLSISACTKETPELKSPCVGIEGSPCDKRRPLYNAA